MTADNSATAHTLSGLAPRYNMTDKEFGCLRQLICRHTGIFLSEHKRDLVYNRLVKRVRACGLSSFQDYCRLIEQVPIDELEHFTNAITTNLTSFFRESHHFNYLRDIIVPDYLESRQANGRMRIWSAGCSTGEEPYSIAMTLRDAIYGIDNRDIRILATDLDSQVLGTAEDGIYPLSCIEGIDSSGMRRWFSKGTGARTGHVRVVDVLRKMVTFRKHNLMDSWPMRGPFDCIFCRNVMIYFDKSTRRTLLDRFADILKPGGFLFIGHSETLYDLSNRFRPMGKTIYQKIS
ncbi:MAG: protein-glutamate O-methyltransferase CheR [Gammaproteobacteria bacterium]